MPYIRKEDRDNLDSTLESLAVIVNTNVDGIEDTLFSVLSRLFGQYVRAGFEPVPLYGYMASENSDIKDAIVALSVFESDSVEGALNFFTSSLLGLTICTEIRYNKINRAIGVLQRVASFLNHHKSSGRGSARLGRALGVLQCVMLEFYRRLAAPYEDTAIERNGDIPFYLKMQLSRITRIITEDTTDCSDLLESAWGIIANSYGGNWDLASDDWKNAANKWRDDYHMTLDK